MQVYDYDRPTPLKDGEQGLANWMRQFFAGQLEALPEQTGQALLARAEELARPKLWDGATGPLTTAACGLWRENLSNKSVFTK